MKQTKMVLTEAQVQSAVMQWLKLHNIPCVRTNAGLAFYEGKDGKRRAMRGLPKGTADIHGICGKTYLRIKNTVKNCEPALEAVDIPGILLAIEVKRPGQKIRPEQKAYLDKINALGGVGIWVNSTEMLETKLEDARVIC